MQPDKSHLAQFNIGRLVTAADDPSVAEFMENLDRVNAIGKRSPGFVWMMDGSGEPNVGNTATKLDNDPQMVTKLTVWRDATSLGNFFFNTLHRQFFQRRAQWFEVMPEMHFVLWWVPVGHRPTLMEAVDKLERLRRYGDSDQAFGWSYLQTDPPGQFGHNVGEPAGAT